MPEADAKDRLLAEQLLQRGVEVADRRWIAGAVGEEDAVGVEREDLLGSRGRRKHGDLAAGLGEPAQDVVLDARVHGHDAVRRRHRQDAGVDRQLAAGRHLEAPAVRLAGWRPRRRDPCRQGPPTPRHARRARALSDSVVEMTARIAPRSRRWRVRRRVSTPAMATTPRACEEVGQRLLGAPARRLVAHVAHHEALGEDAPRLHVGAVDPVVADVRHRHGDDLPGVARVGKHFLVAGHRGVEAQLPAGLTIGTTRDAGEDRAVLERQNRGARRHLVDHLSVAQSELALDQDLARLAQ